MKATMTIVCLMILLVFGFLVQAQEIPGGIVYSDGKNAIYKEFATGKTTNLTADLKGPPINGPLAISEDGLILTWLQGNKFLARRLPDGKPSVALPEKLSIAGCPFFSSKLSLSGKNIRNLMLSPEGTHLAFESTEKGDYWVKIEPGKSRPSRPGGYDHYPKYSKEVGKAEYNAITHLNTVSGIGGRYGNTAFWPPLSTPYRTTKTVDYNPNKKVRRPGEVVESAISGDDRTPPDIRPGLSMTRAEARAKCKIKRDAHFLAWQKASTWRSQQFIAFIYKTDKGWSPIEIRDVGPNVNRTDNTSPGVWEIPVSLKSCNGLAWKPDGSLTYLSEEKVFSLDAKQISEGIKNSGIGRDNNSSNPLKPRIPVRNILNIEGVLVAYNINGDRLHWVTNDTFLFRGKEEGNQRAFYSWRDGNIEKLLSPAPEEFSYCDRAPFGITTGPITTGTISGKDRAKESGGQRNHFYIGSIKTQWLRYNSYFVRIRAGRGQGDEFEELEYALPFETSIEEIHDPSKYDYRKIPKKAGESPYVDIKLGQIILLKSNNRYAAIKPVDIELKYKSVAEMPVEMQSQWQDWKGPPPFWEWMTYEWKFWPASSVGALSKDSRIKPVSNFLRQTSGKSEALEKNFVLFPDKTPPEFFITAGDIKTVWEYPDSYQGVHIRVGGMNVAPLANLEYTWTDNISRIEDIVPTHFKFAQSSNNSLVIGIRFNTIMLLKLGNKYAAIKPIAVSQKYKSIEEMPEKLRNDLLANLHPRALRPSGKCLTYEWKYWEIPGGKEKPPQPKTTKETLSQIIEEQLKTTKKERVSFTSPEAILSVGGIQTVWSLTDSRIPSLVVNPKQETLEGLEFSYPRETDIEQIENPAGYNYQKALQSMKIAVSLNHVLLLKLEDSYAAIKPLEIGPKGTWIDFEWKSWSAIENKIATKSP